MLRMRDRRSPVARARLRDHGSEVVAVYDDDAGIIDLPLELRGETTADLSVLGHETVHR